MSNSSITCEGYILEDGLSEYTETKKYRKHLMNQIYHLGYKQVNINRIIIKK